MVDINSLNLVNDNIVNENLADTVNFDDIDKFTTNSFQLVEDKTIHIRLIRRNRRQSTTIVDGMEKKYHKKLLSSIKKKCCCGGNIKNDKTYGKVVMVQGDQTKSIRDYIISKKIRKDCDIKLHGC